MKMIHNDASNHQTENDVVKNLVGEDKANVINWVADEQVREIMDAMQSGAKELDEIIRKRETEVGDIMQCTKDKAYAAQNEFFTA